MKLWMKMYINYWEKRYRILKACGFFIILAIIMNSVLTFIFALITYLVIRATDVFVEPRWRKLK